MNLERFRDDDDAVSPVVGAPLMVAVTVVLASAVGTSVFGMASVVDDSKEPVFAGVAVDYEDSNDRVSVTWYANGHAEKLEVLLTVNGHASETVRLFQVGDSVRIDRHGITISGSVTGRDTTPHLSNGDEVTVTVVAIDGGQRTTVAHHTNTV